MACGSNMTAERITQGTIEPIIAPVIDGVGGAVSGATITTRIQRLSDNFFFDWDDDTFKAFGSVGAVDQALTEFANQILYRLDTATHDEGFNTAAITNPAPDDTYIVSFDVTAPAGAVGPGLIEIKVDQWVAYVQETWTSLGMNLAAPASYDFPGGFVQARTHATPIDLAISGLGTTVTLTRQP